MGVAGAAHHPSPGGRHTTVLHDMLLYLEHSPRFEPVGNSATRNHAVPQSCAHGAARTSWILIGLQGSVVACHMRSCVVAVPVQRSRVPGTGL